MWNHVTILPIPTPDTDHQCTGIMLRKTCKHFLNNDNIKQLTRNKPNIAIRYNFPFQYNKMWNAYKISQHYCDLHACSISSHRRLGASPLDSFSTTYFGLYMVFLLVFGILIDHIALAIIYSINSGQKYYILSKKREMTYPYGLSPWPRGEEPVFVYPKCIIYYGEVFMHIVLKLLLY